MKLLKALKNELLASLKIWNIEVLKFTLKISVLKLIWILNNIPTTVILLIF